MMKTLFLNPPSFGRFDSAGARFQAVRKTSSLWHPAWLGYAAALVPGSRLLDCPAEAMGIDSMIEIARGYDLVVIYTSTPSFKNDIGVAQKIKSEVPGVKIVAVGPHVSVLTEQTLKASEAIDAVARKEFEQTILEIAEGKGWSEIAGLSYRQGKVIKHNPDRKLLMDLDKLPFVAPVYKRDLPLRAYHLPFTLNPYLAIYAGRGCPNQCTFCLWPQTFTGRFYRKRSVDNVIKEVRWIKENMPQIKEIFFDDDTFTVNKAWVAEFCQKIKPLGVVWSVNARADLDLGLMRKMKQAGCRVLVVGYESGNEQILRNVKKGVTNEQMRKFTVLAKKAGLMIHGTFIMGLPGETQETMRQTYNFAIELAPETLQISIATPLPGTEFDNWARKKGFIKENMLVDQHGYQSPTIEYPGLSGQEIADAVEKYHRMYYFRPSYILKQAKIALRSTDEARRIFLSGWEFAKYLIRYYCGSRLFRRQ